MADKRFELPAGVRPIAISKPNFELLLREGRSFEEYFIFEEEDNQERTEQEVLNADVPPDPDEPDVESDPDEESESEEETEPAAEPESAP